MKHSAIDAAVSEGAEVRVFQDPEAKAGSNACRYAAELSVRGTWQSTVWAISASLAMDNMESYLGKCAVQAVKANHERQEKEPGLDDHGQTKVWGIKDVDKDIRRMLVWVSYGAAPADRRALVMEYKDAKELADRITQLFP